MAYKLVLHLKSDTVFGRGDGVAGLVDAEVEHDAYGCPYLGGRTLKGLLAEECDNVCFALLKQNKLEDCWQDARIRLFGRSGGLLDGQAHMRVADAQLPADVRTLIQQAAADDNNSQVTPARVLESLTAIRRQTAVDETGVPESATLRAMRVVIRGTTFEAPLDFATQPQPLDLALLAACVRAFRRAGIARNRGLGLLTAQLHESGEDVTQTYFNEFRREVTS